MSSEFDKLMDVVAWIDENASGISLPSDERSLLASGCFDSAIEHQAAIALLYSSSLYGSMFSLLRVITESLVRGLWILNCATEKEIIKFKKGRLDKKFDTLIKEYEAKIGDTNGVLSQFKKTAWNPMNGFTHTGFIQVSRRHSPGKLGGNYEQVELSHALGVAGALGLIAAGQLVGMAKRSDLTQPFLDKMVEYGNKSP
tara:strand:- start:427 stop:1023 length:597 start_codon:yes stop_codon:yes gene_type:complete